MENDPKNSTVGERMTEARKKRASAVSVSSIGGADKASRSETGSGGIAARRGSRAVDLTPTEKDSGVSSAPASEKKRRSKRSKAAPSRKAQPGTARKKTYYTNRGAKRAAKKKHTGAIIAVVLILLIAGAFIGFYFLAQVNTISVEGNSRYTDQEVIIRSGLYTGRNILLYDLAEARDNIEKDPYIDCIGVSRKLPNEIHIKVREREEFAAIAASGGLYCIIDREGFVLDVAGRDGLDGLIPVYGLGSMGFTTGTSIVADKSKLRPYTLMEIFDAIGDRSSRISSIDISNSASIVINTAEGVKVMLGDSIDIPQKIEYMFRAIEKADAARLSGTVIYVNTNGTADIAYPTPIPTAPAGTDEPTDTGDPAETSAPEDTPAPTETEDTEGP